MITVSRTAIITVTVATMEVFNAVMVWSLVVALVCAGGLLAREGMKHG